MQNDLEFERFEQLLRNDPHDRFHWEVYADWLMEQGDPRGELMRYQLDLESQSLPHLNLHRARRREEDLLFRHIDRWLGSLTPHLVLKSEIDPGAGFQIPTYRRKEPHEFRFKHGFLHSLKLIYGAGFLHLLASEFETRFLERLEIMEPPTAELRRNGSWDRLMHFLEFEDVELPFHQFQNAPWVPMLETLEIRGSCRFGDYRGTGLLQLLPLLDRLTSLTLMFCQIDLTELFSLRLPRLQQMEISGYAAFPLRTLIESQGLPSLKKLSLRGNSFTPDDPPFEEIDFLELLWRDPFPHLEEITLPLSNIGDDSCAELLDSELRFRLKRLDLRYGQITDIGAHLLAAIPQSSPLNSLILAGNPLTNAGINVLKNRGFYVRA